MPHKTMQEVVSINQGMFSLYGRGYTKTHPRAPFFSGLVHIICFSYLRVNRVCMCFIPIYLRTRKFQTKQFRLLKMPDLYTAFW